MTRADRVAAFRRLLGERFVLLGGAMGARIQSHSLGEVDYRGTCCRDWPGDVKGNNDLLTLSRVQLIRDLDARFLGDIVAANANRQPSAALAIA